MPFLSRPRYFVGALHVFPLQPKNLMCCYVLEPCWFCWQEMHGKRVNEVMQLFNWWMLIILYGPSQKLLYEHEVGIKWHRHVVAEWNSVVIILPNSGISLATLLPWFYDPVLRFYIFRFCHPLLFSYVSNVFDLNLNYFTAVTGLCLYLFFFFLDSVLL